MAAADNAGAAEVRVATPTDDRYPGEIIDFATGDGFVQTDHSVAGTARGRSALANNCRCCSGAGDRSVLIDSEIANGVAFTTVQSGPVDGECVSSRWNGDGRSRVRICKLDCTAQAAIIRNRIVANR